MEGKGDFGREPKREGLACGLALKFSFLSLSNLCQARVDTLYCRAGWKCWELKVYSFKTSCNSVSLENILLSFSDLNISTTSSVNFARCCANLRFYQMLTIFGSLITFFTSEDLLQIKTDRNRLGSRSSYFKVSPVLKTTRDVKTVKALKRFTKVINLRKESHWKLYWHLVQYCQKISPPWKTDVSSKYLVRFIKSVLFTILLSFIKLDFIVILFSLKI